MIHVADKNHRGKYSNARTGTYIMQHPEKYSGAEKPVYKSNLEYLAMRYLDSNPCILKWSYEGTHINYIDQSSNPPRQRRYFIDFTCTAKIGTQVKTIWLEIKPQSEVDKPSVKSNNKTKALWLKNQCKWQAARKLAESKGCEFKILTEKQLQ